MKLALVVLLTALIEHARADTFVLRQAFYTSAEGHGVALSSYLAVQDLQPLYADRATCYQAALRVRNQFKTGRMSDQSVLLVDTWCEMLDKPKPKKKKP